MIQALTLLRSNAVILDTETTGVDSTAQIIQLAIIDMGGATLFNSLFRPTCAIHRTATDTHGMEAKHLIGAPKFTALAEQVRGLLMNRPVIIYNVVFDRRMLRQTFSTFKLEAAWVDELDFHCAMKLYAESLGTTKNPKLEGGDHTALGDCLATLSLLRRMAGVENVKGERVLTPSQQAYRNLKNTLTELRGECVLVYRNTEQYDEKTQRIDDALKALDLLAITIRDLQDGTVATAKQETLFGR